MARADVKWNPAPALAVDGNCSDGPGSQSQASVCGRPAAPLPGSRPRPRGTVTAAPRWQRSGCRHTLRSSVPPPGGRSPWGPNGAPGFLRRGRVKIYKNSVKDIGSLKPCDCPAGFGNH